MNDSNLNPRPSLESNQSFESEDSGYVRKASFRVLSEEQKQIFKNSIVSNELLLPSNFAQKSELDLFNIFAIFAASILLSVSIIFPKLMMTRFPHEFSVVTYFSLRSFLTCVTILAEKYFFEDVNMLNYVRETGHKKWFFLRANCTALGLLFYVLSLYYLRCFSSQIIIICTLPLLNEAGKYFKDEQGVTQPLILSAFAALATYLMVFINEFIECKDSKDVLQSVLIILVSCLFYSGISLANVRLNLDEHDILVHLFWNNIILCAYYAIIFVVKAVTTGVKMSAKYAFYCAVSSSVFFLADFLTNYVINSLAQKGVKNAKNLNGPFLWVVNFKCFYVLLLCYLYCQETIYFTDCVCAGVTMIYKIVYNLLTDQSSVLLFN